MKVAQMIMDSWREHETIDKLKGKNIYEVKGYKDREDYLRQLAIKHNITYKLCYSLAILYGKSNDFTELIDIIEDLNSL